MTRLDKVAPLLTLALAGLTACSVPKDASFPEVKSAADARTDHRIFWNQGGESDAQVARVIAGMLAHKMTADEAVQVALLGNRNMQATYEDLSVAQADVVQAGLLQNPVFSGGVQLPLAGSGNILHLGVEQDFLSLLLLPARKRLAASAFESVTLRVANEVVDFAFEVRAAYFELQGAQQVTAMCRLVQDGADAAAELARRQYEAGNLGELDLRNQEDALAQARVTLARSDAAMTVAREKLTRLMGLWGPEAAYAIADALPPLPPEDPPLEHVESLAVRQRLDIAAARQDVEARSYALSMATDWRWLGGAGVGLDYESDADGRFLGPAARIELPIFDQKQAVIASRAAELRRSVAKLHALSVEARSEVREARSRVEVARRIVEQYRTDTVPRRERIVALTLEKYNAMLVGVYQVLTAKQGEVEAYRDYIEAVRDYWVARADLDRAAGGRVEAAGALPAGASVPRPAPAEHVHGGGQ